MPVSKAPPTDAPPEPAPLPWHAEAWHRLAAVITEDRLPHALLLEGDPGTGRELFAQALARRLLCHAPVHNRHCGECKSCRLVATGVHADLRTVYPVDEGKAIGIAAARDAIAFASRTASIGKRKVILFSPAELLTTAAFNAFLKCLEEPSPDTVILLVFARGYPLPATIRSRCQRWLLPSPSAASASTWLTAQLQGTLKTTTDVDDGIGVESALSLSDGRPLAALALLSQGGSLHGDSFSLALHKQGENGYQGLAILERAAADLAVSTVLDLLARHVQRWLREQSGDGLRSPRAHRAFSALSTLATLRRAQQAGTNPNEDLVRFSALKACAGLWE